MSAGNVLLVKVEVLVRHPLAEYLRECGYRVFEAAEAGEAKRLLASDQVAIDIVLAEGACGFALAAWLRENQPRVQLMQAGNVARATEKAAELCAESDTRIMPYEHKFVLQRIRRALATRERARLAPAR